MASSTMEEVRFTGQPWLLIFSLKQIEIVQLKQILES